MSGVGVLGTLPECPFVAREGAEAAVEALLERYGLHAIVQADRQARTVYQIGGQADCDPEWWEGEPDDLSLVDLLQPLQAEGTAWGWCYTVWLGLPTWTQGMVTPEGSTSTGISHVAEEQRRALGVRDSLPVQPFAVRPRGVPAW